MVAAQTRFGLLGEVEAWIVGQSVGVGHARQQCVLVALLVDANRAVPIDQLIDRVWADRPPHRTREALYTYLSRLRQVLAKAVDVRITRKSGGYQLAVDPMTIDLHRFRFLVGQARLARDDDVKAAAFEQALGLWRGPALPALDTPWLNSVRDAMDQERVTTELDLNDLALHRGRHTELLAQLFTAVAGRPLDERLTGQLVLALYRCGRQADALEQHRQIRIRLAEELGVDPSPALQRLHQQILTADSALEAPSANAGPPVTTEALANVDSSGSEARFASSVEAEPAPRVAMEVHPAPRVWNVPARNPRFTGRAGMLEELHGRLRSGEDTVVVQTLYGLGGVGKTQAAIEYAHRSAADYDLVWWIAAERPALIPGQLAVLADRLGLPSQGAVSGAVERLLIELTRRTPWLLIFDNAEHPDDIAGYRPAGTGQILVTSRYPGWGALGGRVEVDVLARAETTSLLRAWIPQMTAQEADKLAAELGDLPLAAAQAAAYLEQTGSAAADYLRRFGDQRAVLLARGEVLGYQGRVDTAWLLALDRLRVDNPAVVQLLELAAFLAPEPIPVGLFTDHCELLDPPLQDPDAVTDAIGVAVSYSLIRRNTDAFQVHRLVQAVIRHRLAIDRRDAVPARVLALLTAACPGESDDPSDWPVLAGRLAPHLLAIGALADKHPAGRRLMLATVGYLDNRGDTRASERIAEELHRRWQRQLGEDHPDTLAAAAALTAALTWRGRGEQGCALGEDALRRSGRVLGPDHPVTLRLAASLTHALAWQGHSEQACTLGEDTLHRSRRLLGPAAPDTLRLAAHLVVPLAWQGRVEEARTLSEDTVRRSREALGADHSLTLFCVSGLALARAWSGDLEAIGGLGEDTLQRCRDAIGPDHPTTLGLAAYLTFSLGSQDQFQRARALGEDTLRRSREAHGPDHLITITTSSVLAFTLAAAGEAEQARVLGEDTLHRTRTALGPDNLITWVCAAALTAALAQLGQSVRARAVGEDTLQRSRTALGPDHPVTLAVAQTLGRLTHDQDTD